MNKYFNYLLHPNEAIIALAAHGLLPFVSDRKLLEMKFKTRMGYKPDLDNPQTFNEKLQWLKLHDRKPQYTPMVDKFEAKEYVASIIGEQYIIPTLGVWDFFDDIDFAHLPEQFVLKCTHDSGGVVICSDKSKFDKEKARAKINHSLKMNYYLISREWPYKNVKPRIIAERYMTDESGVELKDYKFMCFGGKVKCIFTGTERFSDDGLKVTFFDPKWNRLPFERHYPQSAKQIPKPHNLEKMICLAETLSHDIPFVRVDFYESGGEVYFGEMTFYPGGGFEEFSPEEWDCTLGGWINLPKM